jgi:hypothetical protein
MVDGGRRKSETVRKERAGIGLGAGADRQRPGLNQNTVPKILQSLVCAGMIAARLENETLVHLSVAAVSG